MNKNIQNNLNDNHFLFQQRTKDRLQELLDEDNYPGAISLLLECQSAAQIYKHFHCVAALNGRLQDTLEQVEKTLDMTLAKMCTGFDVTTYSSVQEAYKLLGKSQTAMDQLHRHFTVAINNTTFVAVQVQEDFIPCLTKLCKSMWAILSSYYLIVRWHGTQEHSSKQKCLEYTNVEANFDKQYVKQKLENGIVTIWRDIERKISTFMETDLSNFKFEQFVQVLGITNR